MTHDPDLEESITKGNLCIAYSAVIQDLKRSRCKDRKQAITILQGMLEKRRKEKDAFDAARWPKKEKKQ